MCDTTILDILRRNRAFRTGRRRDYDRFIPGGLKAPQIPLNQGRSFPVQSRARSDDRSGPIPAKGSHTSTYQSFLSIPSESNSVQLS